MLLFVCIMAVLLPLSFLLIKTMNLLLLGDGYARNLGLNIKRARLLVISCSGVLVAIVTAYCGPIMFIGLAVPHLCRAIFHTFRPSHIDARYLAGRRSLALVCNLIAACRDSRERCRQFGNCAGRCAGGCIRAFQKEKRGVERIKYQVY